ncbi:hypothetical protein [Pseudobdellovibrio exovorus]|uniref:Uncharacterized protein n=1 Tax=Pseudobdellovibrio exovorus JSS TaxID=1184267 RepID=M4VRS0_9BACT|nr:hypothetical protein [Pseudobdellovibrio exovorus]AGH95884.1 hypothetical protein A11Q_1668 [Pseudobdellovibrio exovorus JSS]
MSLNLLLASFVIWIATTHVASAQMRRDPLYIDNIVVGDSDVRGLDFGFGLIPPVKFGNILWINSFSGHQWELNEVRNLPLDQIRFSQYRYSPMLVAPLAEGASMSFGLPMTFAALEHEPRLRNDSYFNNIFVAYSRRSEADDATWSLGFVVLDKSKRRHIFPTGSYSYASDDRKWRFAFGFPFIAITYFLNEYAEFGTFLGRDTSLNYIPDDHPLAPQGRYLDQEHTAVGIASRFYLPHNMKLNIILGSMFRGRYRFMDSDYNETLRLKDYEDLSYLRVGLAWGITKPAAKKSDSKAEDCTPDKDCTIRSEAKPSP